MSKLVDLILKLIVAIVIIYIGVPILYLIVWFFFDHMIPCIIGMSNHFTEAWRYMLGW